MLHGAIHRLAEDRRQCQKMYRIIAPFLLLPFHRVRPLDRQRVEGAKNEHHAS